MWIHLECADTSKKNNQWQDYWHEVILHEIRYTTFFEAHGQYAYKYVKQDLEVGQLFSVAMVTQCRAHVSNLLDHCIQSGMLDGVNSLVDVGGGWGMTVSYMKEERVGEK